MTNSDVPFEVHRVRNVQAMGECFGYGRVMQLCEELWRDKAVSEGREGSELTVGPCAVFLVPCKHWVKDKNGHCEVCCGSGRVTKFVALILDMGTAVRDHLPAPQGEVAT